MSDGELDEFLDTLDGDEVMGGGDEDGGMSGVAAGAFSGARSSPRSSNSGGGRKSSSSPSSPDNREGKAAAGAIVKFPVKLHDMLTQSQLSNGIVEWRQDGTCFKILNRERLASELLPIYFVRKYHSSDAAYVFIVNHCVRLHSIQL